MVHASCVHVTFFDVCCYSDVIFNHRQRFMLREACVEAYPSSAHGHRVKVMVSASVLVNNELKDWVGKPSTSNQSVVKTCPECTRSSPRRLPKFPNRLLLIESSVCRRLWAKSLWKVVVVPSIKGEFQNVHLTCFKTRAFLESKLAFGRARKTSCFLFRRANDASWMCV